MAMKLNNVLYIFSAYLSISILLQMSGRIHAKENGQTFKSILMTDSAPYVDKTLFMKTLIDENENFTLITAPPKFGKTTLLTMLKNFLKIKVNNKGETCHFDNPVAETYNYTLFKENRFKITKYPELFEEHFGRTPVIHVDFKPLNGDIMIKTFYDAVRFFKLVIHTSFKQHEYLVHSPRLSDDQRHYIQTWCDMHSYKTMVDTIYVSLGLQSLSQYLRTHFHQRRVFVLVDNYDYLIRCAMYRGEKLAEVEEIVKYVVDIIKDVVKGNEENVKGALITGVSNFPFIKKSDFNYCSTYTFLGSHKYFKYYGFTREEVVQLISNPFKNYNEKRIAEWYNGFQNSKGKKVFNMFSTLEFLETGEFDSYYSNSTFPKHLNKLLRSPLIQNAVKQLLQNKTLAMENSNSSISDYFNLYKSVCDSKYDLTSLFLNEMLEWGFLTYDSVQESFLDGVDVMRNFKSVRIPNLDVMEVLSKKHYR